MQDRSLQVTETDRSGFLGAIRPRRITPVLRRALRAARRASSSESEIRNLYEFTRRTLQMNLNEKPGPQLAGAVLDLFGLDAVAIFDADLEEVYQAGRWSLDPGEMAQNVYHFETSDNDRHTGIGRRVIRLGTVPVGSLVIRGDLSPLTNNALAALIAVTFDRYRATANESRMEAEREAERMRSTVLDSLAHAYKTPLTAIRAASSGLAEMGHLSPAQAELVALIDEQASLLNELTTRLLTTATLGGETSAGPALSLKLENVNAAALIGDVVSAGERSGERQSGSKSIPAFRFLATSASLPCCWRSTLIMPASIPIPDRRSLCAPNGRTRNFCSPCTVTGQSSRRKTANGSSIDTSVPVRLQSGRRVPASASPSPNALRSPMGDRFGFRVTNTMAPLFTPPFPAPQKRLKTRPETPGDSHDSDSRASR